MKIAVIGSNLEAIESAIHFHEIGAHVKIFSPSGALDTTLFNLLDSRPEFDLGLSWKELTSKVGRSLLLSNFSLNEKPLLRDFCQRYFQPLQDYIEKNDLISKHRFKRVQKRFLESDELPLSENRMSDLFRIVFEVTPEQNQERVDLFKSKLNEDIIKSLEKSYENFEDFDVVIYAKEGSPFRLGPSGNAAIGEHEIFKNQNCFYSYCQLQDVADFKNKEIVLVGTSKDAAIWCLLLDGVLTKFESTSLTIITSEKKPFEKLKKNEKEKFIVKKLDEFFIRFQNILKSKRESNPELNGQISFVCGASIVAVDKLIDQEQVFLTYEVPPLRVGESGDDIPFTLKADKLIVAKGKKLLESDFSGLNIKNRDSLESSPIVKSEPGFYFLGGVKRVFSYDKMQSDEDQSEMEATLLEVEQDLMNFFSRA